MSAFEIQQMPRSEKLKLMETLWADLSRDEAEVESPAWHADA
ncbi:MAG TPA: addiction module protein [Verrucomicrobiae bacterium]